MNTQRTVVVSDDSIGVNSTVIDLIKPNLTAIGGGGVDNNWLGKLPVGARFLFRMKSPQSHTGPDVGVQMAEVQVKFKTCTQLYDGLNKPVKFIVDNLAFSAMMYCVEELPAFNQEGTDNVLELTGFHEPERVVHNELPSTGGTELPQS